MMSCIVDIEEERWGAGGEDERKGAGGGGGGGRLLYHNNGHPITISITVEVNNRLIILLIVLFGKVTVVRSR